ncbi:D-alanyl-D-alanine carboxypeptidase family protein [Alkalibacter saccharofermentans]|uniref:serine-type D-Ala-D-Ala carboxypeptidase n=1 Tax=Alkalibacter saccharofermentans DSM 14828 TaxID=1120975 RepID=A0A1M4XBW5_9FIRM|nr:D-alanyl-D-alanine carboxypeptidase family protein [Alkalibacter saccharofermentans]SHE90682.1 D-alanyl-D-alanine carboxypeptidase (penicillin-binding protein 5/6) [Alkalibacter saccharofermentans DSM 14828]
MFRKVLLTLAALFLFSGSNTVNAQPLVESEAAILMDGNTGQVLFEKNSHDIHYPASITKILTALILVENTDPSDNIIVGEDVPFLIERGSSQVYLIPGEVLTAEQMLNALMIESANDAAVAIAQHISGSIEEFSALMNKRAKELGATDTNFTNPSGLHDDNHYTTAYDMAMIMKEVITHPELRDVMTTINYKIPKTQHQEERYLWTKNRLIRSPSNEYYYEDVTATKTGFTSMAGNTLVTSAARDSLSLITVVLKSRGVMTYIDTCNMLDYGFDNFTTTVLSEPNQLVKSIPFAGENLDLLADNRLVCTIPKDQASLIDAKVLVSENLDLPLDKGEVVGEVVYTLKGIEIGKVALLSAQAISKPFNLIDLVKSVAGAAFAILLASYSVLRVYVSRQNRKIRRRKKLKKIKNEYSKF